MRRKSNPPYRARRRAREATARVWAVAVDRVAAALARLDSDLVVAIRLSLLTGRPAQRLLSDDDIIQMIEATRPLPPEGQAASEHAPPPLPKRPPEAGPVVSGAS